jgi:cysteine desulfurase
MSPYFGGCYGNPSSIHMEGQLAKKALEDARQKVASLIGAEQDEAIFTSGGTEANNLAICGIAAESRGKGNHIITTVIEHHSVLNTCKYLNQRGYDITYLPVDREGLVMPEQVIDAISDKTILVSVMHANNEIGTIEPVAEIGAICKETGIVFHVDAIQTVGKIPVNVDNLNVDLLSLSGHKIYGPKGIGALYLRKGTKIIPFMHGGHQERGLRPGTENIAAIVGLGKASEIAHREHLSQTRQMKCLRDHLEAQILKKLGEVDINGHPQMRLPHILNVSIEGIEAEAVVREMDKNGIAISAGSACTSDSIEISHVIKALGKPRHIAMGSIRFSLGRDTSYEEIIKTADIFMEVVAKQKYYAELESSLKQRRCV